MSCPICHTSETYLLYSENISGNYFNSPYQISSSDYGKHTGIYKCRACGMTYENVVGLSKKIDRHYQTLYDNEYESERNNRSKAFIRIIKKISEFKPNGRILDIGCATGAFLSESKKFGYETYGIEPSVWASNIAQKVYQLKVKTGKTDIIPYPKNYFDVITLLDVIEHLCEPNKVMKEIARVLKKGGLLCIVTPNIESLLARVLKERWWHIRPSHLFYFSHRTLTSLLIKEGFSVEKIQDYQWYFSATYILERVLKMLSLKLNKYPKILSQITLPLKLYDSMEIYAIKV